MMQCPSDLQLRKLSPGERHSHERDGYVVIDDVFPPAELAAIDAEITRLRGLPDGREDPNFILKLGLRSPLTRSICADERVLTLIEDLVKPGIAIYSAKMVEKAPGDMTICHWHQDDAYYSQKSASNCRMSVWIPLQVCDERNGCMWVVPGSHTQGLQRYEERRDGICNLSFRHGGEGIAAAIPCRIRAGSIILFSALTWHRSLGNQTDKPRRSFIISYQEATALRGNGQQHKILRPAGSVVRDP